MFFIMWFKEFLLLYKKSKKQCFCLQQHNYQAEIYIQCQRHWWAGSFSLKNVGKNQEAIRSFNLQAFVKQRSKTRALVKQMALSVGFGNHINWGDRPEFCESIWIYFNITQMNSSIESWTLWESIKYQYLHTWRLLAGETEWEKGV